MCDDKCICKGNWREIIEESEPFFNRTYRDKKGRRYRFLGVVHADDDYYYLLMRRDGSFELATCVSDLEGHGYSLIEEVDSRIRTPEETLIKSLAKD